MWLLSLSFGLKNLTTYMIWQQKIENKLKVRQNHGDQTLKFSYLNERRYILTDIEFFCFTK